MYSAAMTVYWPSSAPLTLYYTVCLHRGTQMQKKNICLAVLILIGTIGWRGAHPAQSVPFFQRQRAEKSHRMNVTHLKKKKTPPKQHRVKRWGGRDSLLVSFTAGATKAAGERSKMVSWRHRKIHPHSFGRN